MRYRLDDEEPMNSNFGHNYLKSNPFRQQCITLDPDLAIDLVNGLSTGKTCARHLGHTGGAM